MSTLCYRSGAASTTMWPIVVGPSLRNEDNSMRSVSSPTVAPSKQLTNPSSMKTINVIGYKNPSMSSQTSPRTLSLTIAAAAARSTASLVKKPDSCVFTFQYGRDRNLRDERRMLLGDFGEGNNLEIRQFEHSATIQGVFAWHAYFSLDRKGNPHAKPEPLQNCRSCAMAIPGHG